MNTSFRNDTGDNCVSIFYSLSNSFINRLVSVLCHDNLCFCEITKSPLLWLPTVSLKSRGRSLESLTHEGFLETETKGKNNRVVKEPSSGPVSLYGLCKLHRLMVYSYSFCVLFESKLKLRSCYDRSRDYYGVKIPRYLFCYPSRRVTQGQIGDGSSQVHRGTLFRN